MAASNQRLSRDQSWSALVTATSRLSKEVSCQTITRSPRATPTGETNKLQTGKRERRMPAAIARRSSEIRLGVGTQSACSTDQITTIKLTVSSATDSQPSEGRKSLANATNPSPRLSRLMRPRRGMAPASPLGVTGRLPRP